MKSSKHSNLVEASKAFLGASLMVVLFSGVTEAATNLQPVAFYKFSSNIPEQKSAVVAESISRHLAAALVDVYATEMIGASSSFSPKLDLAVIGSATYGISQLDLAMEKIVMPEVAPILKTLSQDEEATFAIEIYWADAETISALPADSRIGPGIIEAMQLTGNATASKLVAQHWVDIDEVDPSGTIRASLFSTKILRQLSVEYPEQWVPFKSELTFTIDSGGIGLNIFSLMHPYYFMKMLHKDQPGIILDELMYVPSITNAYIDVAKLSIKRQYTARPSDGSNAMHVTFGSWEESKFSTCKGDKCLASVDRVPTIHARVNFTATSWWGSLVGWFRSWIISKVDLRIMLQDIWLTCDRETQELSVDPSKSIIPIALTTDEAFGSGAAYMLKNSTTSLGFNFYEMFVGTQVTSGLSADLNNSVRAADLALSESIANALNHVVQP